MKLKISYDNSKDKLIMSNLITSFTELCVYFDYHYKDVKLLNAQYENVLIKNEIKRKLVYYFDLKQNILSDEFIKILLKYFIFDISNTNVLRIYKKYKG